MLKLHFTESGGLRCEEVMILMRSVTIRRPQPQITQIMIGDGIRAGGPTSFLDPCQGSGE